MAFTGGAPRPDAPNLIRIFRSLGDIQRLPEVLLFSSSEVSLASVWAQNDTETVSGIELLEPWWSTRSHPSPIFSSLYSCFSHVNRSQSPCRAAESESVACRTPLVRHWLSRDQTSTAHMLPRDEHRLSMFKLPFQSRYRQLDSRDIPNVKVLAIPSNQRC